MFTACLRLHLHFGAPTLCRALLAALRRFDLAARLPRARLRP